MEDNIFDKIHDVDLQKTMETSYINYAIVAMVGGIILGIVEALVSGFISSTFRDAAAFAILILILLYKPQGLFGKNIREKV